MHFTWTLWSRTVLFICFLFIEFRSQQSHLLLHEKQLLWNTKRWQYRLIINIILRYYMFMISITYNYFSLCFQDGNLLFSILEFGFYRVSHILTSDWWVIFGIDLFAFTFLCLRLRKRTAYIVFIYRITPCRFVCIYYTWLKKYNIN